MSFTVSILQQGLIYGIIALGVYISYKILDFPDLTVDGSFTLGASVAAISIISGVDPWVACVLALTCGLLAGIITGLLHVYGKITNLLCGIITMTALYSVNLVIMERPNISLAGQPNIFRSGFFGSDAITRLILIAIIVLIIKLILDWFFRTKKGMLIRAVGSNPQLVTSIGGNVGTYKIIGLSISNGLVAFAGSLMAQLQNFADVGMSSGVIILGLISVILGITISKGLKFISGSTASIVGAVIYQAVIGTALYLGMPTAFLRLTMATLLVTILLIGRIKREDTLK
ncbi:MAG: ABC transporter permease [Oscillospiraceae bacterium]|nr:ABC transporter permease [Oscillospiraceae bacterium]